MKKSKLLLFTKLLKPKFFLFSLITIFVIISGVSCQKDFSEQPVFNLNDELTSKSVQGWYYGFFKKSSEFTTFNQKKNGLKFPDWHYGIKAKIAGWDVIEFPLIRAKSSFSIPNATSLSDADCKRIKTASLSRILFIKWKGQIGVREIEYIPELQYLKTKPFYGNEVKSVGTIGDFTGTIIIKDWAANIISIQTVVKGKTIRTGKKKTIASFSNTIGKESETTNTLGSCMEYCVWITDCELTFYGDSYTFECGEPYNSGDCWVEGDCGGDPEPDPCELYGCPDPEPPSSPEENLDGAADICKVSFRFHRFVEPQNSIGGWQVAGTSGIHMNILDLTTGEVVPIYLPTMYFGLPVYRNGEYYSTNTASGIAADAVEYAEEKVMDYYHSLGGAVNVVGILLYYRQMMNDYMQSNNSGSASLTPGLNINVSDIGSAQYGWPIIGCL